MDFGFTYPRKLASGMVQFCLTLVREDVTIFTIPGWRVDANNNIFPPASKNRGEWHPVVIGGSGMDILRSKVAAANVYSQGQQCR